jgi:hypothetical protein
MDAFSTERLEQRASMMRLRPRSGTRSKPLTVVCAQGSHCAPGWNVDRGKQGTVALPT